MNDNWIIQVSPKLPDGTLVNLRSDNLEDFAGYLEWLLGNASAIHSVVAALNAPSAYRPERQQKPSYGATPPPAAAPAPQQYSQQPQDSAPPAPSCGHGTRLYKEGVGKNGKAWRAYFCPSTDRSSQCDPEWVK